ncbi:glutamyl-tRNA reductase [Bradymonadaceae bacterium TMQ3]|uniref:Glutamyl-tRNA reductase n=1 Tax=Lujinxingia sediminis TaxID=2480984 RepID=A0ABY0CWR9_9DELT|nr:glutamyl-tRNA reductase [Lujinxingia sediminis]RDV39606.1 glutamyl-tRNA reductase [Bradymonadaceae bacterium TMQ3]RVU48347.1 glutamyl-tRNA reductase [Lujinxingia sediminis]TXC77649.1 glutamyl-tRNA reductase [Bradymonadales bacterium TMQ1]
MTSPNRLTLISFSHRNATLAERDALAMSAADIAAFVPLCRQRWLSEAAVLSTCNRTEIYLYGPTPYALWEELAPELARLRGIELAALPSPMVAYDDAAARHAFRVATSLESLALGENQILAQIKDVHDQILANPAKSPVLDRLFQFAIRVGKQVRTETALCEGAVSISSAAVDLASKIFGDFNQREILLVGAGETAEAAAMHFEKSGGTRFVVLNRSEERGRLLADQFHGIYRPLDELEDAIVSAEVAVFATGSPDYLLTHAALKSVMRARERRPLFLIDISNPRNVDPEVARFDSVFLYNIDDLEHVVAANLATRKDEIPAAEAIIEQMLAQWLAWQQSMAVTPTIASLARYFEDVCTQEIDRHNKRISEQERVMLEEFSRGLVKKLLHNPISYLRTSVANNTLRSEDLNLVLSLYNLQNNDENPDEP